MGFLCFLNINSVVNTYDYFKLIPANADKFITRYSPLSKNWVGLTDHIKFLPGGPVLISGFLGTAKPHFISSIIEPRGSIIGTDIQKFWDLYSIPLLEQQKDFTPNDLLIIKPGTPKINLSIKTNASMLAELTNIAIIEEESSDPIDWPENMKLISRYRWRFSPIGDVIQKNIYSDILLNIDGKVIGKDRTGSVNITDNITILPSCSKNCEQLYCELIFRDKVDNKDLVLPVALTQYKIIKNKLIFKYDPLKLPSILINFKKHNRLENIYLFEINSN